MVLRWAGMKLLHAALQSGPQNLRAVLLCAILFRLDSNYIFTHIIYGIASLVVVAPLRLPRCKWSNPEGYDWVRPAPNLTQNTTKRKSYVYLLHTINPAIFWNKQHTKIYRKAWPWYTDYMYIINLNVMHGRLFDRTLFSLPSVPCWDEIPFLL